MLFDAALFEATPGLDTNPESAVPDRGVKRKAEAEAEAEAASPTGRAPPAEASTAGSAAVAQDADAVGTPGTVSEAFTLDASGNLVATLGVPRSAVGHVIGKGGVNVRRITERTGARVDVAKKEVVGASTREVTVTGTPHEVRAAVSMIKALVDEAEQGDYTREHDAAAVVRNVQCEPELLGRVIGPKGRTANAIRTLYRVRVEVLNEVVVGEDLGTVVIRASSEDAAAAAADAVRGLLACDGREAAASYADSLVGMVAMQPGPAVEDGRAEAVAPSEEPAGPWRAMTCPHPDGSGTLLTYYGNVETGATQWECPW